MSLSSGQEEAVRGAFVRTISQERLRRAWAFERQRQAFETGELLEAGSLAYGPYEGLQDADAEIEQLLAELRAELDDEKAKRHWSDPPPR